MKARDASNYTIEFTPELLAQWRSEDVGLVILQCFPPYYSSKYAEQRRQMRMCAQEGMPFDCYVYDYLGDPTWLDGCLAGLTQAHVEEGLLPRKLRLDEEDTETEAGWSPGQRVEAIAWSHDRAGAWLARYQLPRVSDYSAGWWWIPKTGNSTRFADSELWAAQYDNIADVSVFTPFGGWTSCRIKQYAGSQPDGTDLNVLSADEEAEIVSGGGPVDDAERKQMQDKIDGLVSSLGLVCGDYLKPLTRANAAKYVQTFVGQARAIAEQQGINHA